MDRTGVSPSSLRAAREAHYDQQRSVHSSSRPQSREAPPSPSHATPHDYRNLTELTGPPPILNPHVASVHQEDYLEDEIDSSRREPHASTWRSERSQAKRESRRGPRADTHDLSDDDDELSDIEKEELYRSSIPRHQRYQGRERPGSITRQEEHLTELAAPAPVHVTRGLSGRHRQHIDSPLEPEYLSKADKASPERTSQFATQLYTISYLILFSILGTLARLGLQRLTFYPGAPVVLGVLWANFTGSLFLGFLAEDRRLFRDERGLSNGTVGRSPDIEKPTSTDNAAAKAAYEEVKRTIPLYVGLTTGFCGSLTSFSAFLRDVFLALSNELPTPVNHPYPLGAGPVSPASTVSRNGGYSFMALLAVIILTVSLSLSALKIGAHIAIVLDPFTPNIPSPILRKFLDRATVVLGWGAWLGAVFMAIWPPDRPGGPSGHDSWAQETWRGQAVFALVFAPLGCLLRFYASLKLNGVTPSFPLGTFAVNIFGTAVLGMAYDLQHVRLAGRGLMGGGRTGCQVLQGVMDGFCGCATTVSTWVAELNGLRRAHAYVYGAVSVLVGLGLLVIIMGSVRWTVGWSPPACVT